MDRKLNQFIQQLEIQRYSKSSIKNYVSVIQQFRKYASENNISKPEVKHVKEYLHLKMSSQKVSSSLQKQILASINKYLSIVYNYELDLKDLYPKRKSSYLPNYLSKAEFSNTNPPMKSG